MALKVLVNTEDREPDSNTKIYGMNHESGSRIVSSINGQAKSNCHKKIEVSSKPGAKI